MFKTYHAKQMMKKLLWWFGIGLAIGIIAALTINFLILIWNTTLGCILMVIAVLAVLIMLGRAVSNR